MRTTRASLQAALFILLLVLIALPSCGWRRMAVERHQQSQQLRQLEIERRELELDCLKRKQADPVIDCTQFQRSDAPTKK